ncbi:hypothetical protein [Methanogenium cariaci]|uniref:hypothetical protein n=1 Tax=Methanogenium cariaci TaxID=2197 RepID=UPI000781D7A5|nr:hypothetical protein [Methanogenium cariaci]
MAEEGRIPAEAVEGTTTPVTSASDASLEFRPPESVDIPDVRDLPETAGRPATAGGAAASADVITDPKQKKKWIGLLAGLLHRVRRRLPPL